MCIKDGMWVSRMVGGDDLALDAREVVRDSVRLLQVGEGRCLKGAVGVRARP